MNIDRRTFVVGSLAATVTPLASPVANAMQPLKRSGNARLKLSLAAYSFRNQLHSFRSGKKAADAEMDMLGFIDYAAGLDLDAVELTSYFIPHPCPDELAVQLKQRCHLLGLNISGGAIGNNFAYPPGPELDKQMAYTEQWIKSYSLMGAPVIRVFAGHPKTKGVDEQQAVANIKTNLNAACDIAAKYGVILAMENHDFTTNIDRYLDVIEAVDSPWFGANLDSGNIATTPDPYKELARIAPYALNVQIKVHIPRDGKKEPADFQRLIDIMREANYSGYIVLEYEDNADPYKAVPEYLKQLRDCINA